LSIIEKHESWFDKVSETYEERWYKGDSYKEKWTEEYLKELEKYKGRKILDVGCGTGLQTQAMNALGVDISQGMLNEAEKKGVKTFKAKSSELPFSDNSFDMVVSFNLLEHLLEEERIKTVKEFARVTKSGGTVLIETNNALSPVFYGRPSDYIKTSSTPSDDYGFDSKGEQQVYTHLFSRGEIQELLIRARLELLEVRGLRFVCHMTRFLEEEQFPVETTYLIDCLIGKITWINPRIRYLAVKKWN